MGKTRSGIRSSGASRGGAGSATFHGHNVNLSDSEVAEAAYEYMNWLDKGTARMHAANVMFGMAPGEYEHEGNDMGGFLIRNTVQKVYNRQNSTAKDRITNQDINSTLSEGQRATVYSSIKKGVEQWYNKDSQTKAGAREYRRERKKRGMD